MRFWRHFFDPFKNRAHSKIKISCSHSAKSTLPVPTKLFHNGKISHFSVVEISTSAQNFTYTFTSPITKRTLPAPLSWSVVTIYEGQLFENLAEKKNRFFFFDEKSKRQPVVTDQERGAGSSTTEAKWGMGLRIKISFRIEWKLFCMKKYHCFFKNRGITW